MSLKSIVRHVHSLSILLQKYQVHQPNTSKGRVGLLHLALLKLNVLWSCCDFSGMLFSRDWNKDCTIRLRLQIMSAQEPFSIVSKRQHCMHYCFFGRAGLLRSTALGNKLDSWDERTSPERYFFGNEASDGPRGSNLREHLPLNCFTLFKSFKKLGPMLSRGEPDFSASKYWSWWTGLLQHVILLGTEQCWHSYATTWSKAMPLVLPALTKNI